MSVGLFVQCALFVAFAPCAYGGLPDEGPDVLRVPEAFGGVVVNEGLTREQSASDLVDVSLDIFGSRNVFLAHACTRGLGGRENIANIIILNIARGGSVHFVNSGVLFVNSGVHLVNIGWGFHIEGINAGCLHVFDDLVGLVAAYVPSISHRRNVLRTFVFRTGKEVDVGFFGGVDGVGAPCGAAEELEDVIRLCHNKVVPSRHDGLKGLENCVDGVVGGGAEDLDGGIFEAEGEGDVVARHEGKEGEDAAYADLEGAASAGLGKEMLKAVETGREGTAYVGEFDLTARGEVDAYGAAAEGAELLEDGEQLLAVEEDGGVGRRGLVEDGFADFLAYGFGLDDVGIDADADGKRLGICVIKDGRLGAFAETYFVDAAHGVGADAHVEGLGATFLHGLLAPLATDKEVAREGFGGYALGADSKVGSVAVAVVATSGADGVVSGAKTAGEGARGEDIGGSDIGDDDAAGFVGEGEHQGEFGGRLRLRGALLLGGVGRFGFGGIVLLALGNDAKDGAVGSEGMDFDADIVGACCAENLAETGEVGTEDLAEEFVAGIDLDVHGVEDEMDVGLMVGLEGEGVEDEICALANEREIEEAEIDAFGGLDLRLCAVDDADGDSGMNCKFHDDELVG